MFYKKLKLFDINWNSHVYAVPESLNGVLRYAVCRKALGQENKMELFDVQYTGEQRFGKTKWSSQVYATE